MVVIRGVCLHPTGLTSAATWLTDSCLWWNGDPESTGWIRTVTGESRQHYSRILHPPSATHVLLVCRESYPIPVAHSWPHPSSVVVSSQQPDSDSSGSDYCPNVCSWALLCRLHQCTVRGVTPHMKSVNTDPLTNWPKVCPDQPTAFRRVQAHRSPGDCNIKYLCPPGNVSSLIDVVPIEEWQNPYATASHSRPVAMFHGWSRRGRTYDDGGVLRAH